MKILLILTEAVQLDSELHLKIDLNSLGEIPYSWDKPGLMPQHQAGDANRSGCVPEARTLPSIKANIKNDVSFSAFGTQPDRN